MKTLIKLLLFDGPDAGRIVLEETDTEDGCWMFEKFALVAYASTANDLIDKLAALDRPYPDTLP